MRIEKERILLYDRNKQEDLIMKYFMVEGMLKNVDKLNDEIMKQHMAYTQKAMDEGMIFLSGLKKDQSGGVFLIKSDTEERFKEYLDHEPMHLHGIQDYRYVEFDAHYISEDSHWFS